MSGRMRGYSPKQIFLKVVNRYIGLIMKRWMLDAIVGVSSLIIFLVVLILLPVVLPGSTSYLIALFLFIGVISGGGYLIRNVT